MREGGSDGSRSIYTVGHSNQSLDQFLTLVRGHAIEVIVDVRSQPYSRYAPQFERRSLEGGVTAGGMAYLFLGRELGGRPEGAEFYDAGGHVRYALVAASPPFLRGITRLEKGIATYRVAILCSEENPAGCHRRLLVGRVLADRGVRVLHIRGDGRVESEDEMRALEDAQRRDARRHGSQLALFAEEEVRGDEWKSTRSVLPRDRRPTSLEP